MLRIGVASLALQHSMTRTSTVIVSYCWHPLYGYHARSNNNAICGLSLYTELNLTCAYWCMRTSSQAVLDHSQLMSYQLGVSQGT